MVSSRLTSNDRRLDTLEDMPERARPTRRSRRPRLRWTRRSSSGRARSPTSTRDRGDRRADPDPGPQLRRVDGRDPGRVRPGSARRSSCSAGCAASAPPYQRSAGMLANDLQPVERGDDQPPRSDGGGRADPPAPDPNDRRGTLVEPTEAGHAAWDQAVGTQARREAMIAAVLIGTRSASSSTACCAT